MIPVYILLAIIAIGVLLISETGKAILKWLGGLAVIGGLVYLGFWVVVIITPFCQSFWVACQREIYSNPEGPKTVFLTVIGLIALPFIIIQVFKTIYELIKKIKEQYGSH